MQPADPDRQPEQGAPEWGQRVPRRHRDLFHDPRCGPPVACNPALFGSCRLGMSIVQAAPATAQHKRAIKLAGQAIGNPDDGQTQYARAWMAGGPLHSVQRIAGFAGHHASPLPLHRYLAPSVNSAPLC